MSKTEYDANKLFEAGGILLFFDSPINSEFGIDYNCWRTGENFKGVKMIPPGIHYIYFSVSDKYGNIGLRTGFFHDFKVKEIIAKKWNKKTETIEDFNLTEEQVENFQKSKIEFDKYLGAYPYDEYKRWISLTNNIKYELLKHLIPENKLILSASSLIGKPFKSSKSNHLDDNNLKKKEIFKIPSDIKEAESRLPEMEYEKFTNIRFTKIPQITYPKGSNPSEITAYSIDMSYCLEQIMLNQKINDKTDPLNIIGELQFAFICFLIGHVYDAFEQWKYLINLLCNSENFIKQHPDLFLEFIQVLYFQLKEMPEDFFTDIITSQNFLVVNLHNFFDNIKQIYSEFKDENQNLIEDLNTKCNKFKLYLQDKFKFDFEEEPDEYAPVICEDL